MVTLEGEVTQPGFLKDNAEKAVKEVEGVTSVVNNIEILPLSANDDRIRRAVYRAVYGDPLFLPAWDTGRFHHCISLLKMDTYDWRGWLPISSTATLPASEQTESPAFSA